MTVPPPASSPTIGFLWSPAGDRPTPQKESLLLLPRHEPGLPPIPPRRRGNGSLRHGAPDPETPARPVGLVARCVHRDRHRPPTPLPCRPIWSARQKEGCCSTSHSGRQAATRSAPR